MPYSSPAPLPAPIHTRPAGRPGHRRSYTTTTFSRESGPGAFTSLGALPRRRTAQGVAPSSKRTAVFHIGNDDDDNDDHLHEHHDQNDVDALSNIPPALKLKPNNSLRISISANDEDDTPPLRTRQFPPRESPAHETATAASVPFPSSSSVTSPTAATPTHSTPRPSITRTASTPIMLADGRPLKSSLKSSSSSPNIPFPLQPMSNHVRACSAPSIPSLEHPAAPKNVHFPTQEEGGLATIRVFKRSAKPASLSRPPGEETETETEGELSNGSNSSFIRGPSAIFPFPRTQSPLSEPTRHYDIDSATSSSIPTTKPSSHANVYLESLSLNSSMSDYNTKNPLGMTGSLLVRNIAYEKQVAVRFTLDDWHTTSEVSARHFVSLPDLPASFFESRKLTFGDIAALPPPSTIDNPKWDRFTFNIKLGDYAFNLSQKTMYVVVKYIANAVGGPVESWDNNNGENYKIAFTEAKPGSLNPRSRVFAVSSPSYFPPATTKTSATSQPYHPPMVQTTLLRLKKLSLRNYATPSATDGMKNTSEAHARDHLSTINGMQMEGGFPAHIDNTGIDVKRNENEVNVPHDQSRSPSPVTQATQVTRTETGPASTQPLISVTSPSESSSNVTASGSQDRASRPGSITLFAQPVEIPRPPMLSPLEMGTSPPFSMLSDLGLGGTRAKEGDECSSTPGIPPRGNHNLLPMSSVHWPWGAGSDGKARSEQEVRRMLADIREKSTSSPVRKVSPLGSRTGRMSPTKQQQSQQQEGPVKESLNGDGRRSPIKASESQAQSQTKASTPSVVSPQPRTSFSNGSMPNWSKIGSNWNRGSPVHSSTPSRSSPLVDAAASVGSSPSYTPPYSPPINQDKIYQAFVKQWCFAQGPGPATGSGRTKDGGGHGPLVV